MKFLVFICVSLVFVNIVTSRTLLEADKLIKYIADNAYENQASAKLLNYNQGSRPQLSSQGGYGNVVNPQKSTQLVKKKSSKVLKSSVPGSVQPTYNLIQSSGASQKSSSASLGGYGSQRQTFQTNDNFDSSSVNIFGSAASNPTCRLNFIFVNDVPVQRYCICPDNSYGFTCTENFGNPCRSGTSQFFPAHPSLGPNYFVHCSWDIAYLKICPSPLVWDQNLLTCNWVQTSGQQTVQVSSQESVQYY